MISAFILKASRRDIIHVRCCRFYRLKNCVCKTTAVSSVLKVCQSNINKVNVLALANKRHKVCFCYVLCYTVLGSSPSSSCH